MGRAHNGEAPDAGGAGASITCWNGSEDCQFPTHMSSAQPDTSNRNLCPTRYALTSIEPSAWVETNPDGSVQRSRSE